MIALFSVLAAAGRCYAGGLQNQRTGSPSSDSELMEALNKAMAKNRWIKIKLKDGQLIVGKVSQVSNKDFTFVPAKRPAFRTFPPIKYTNVSTFKQQSGAAKLFDEIGGKTLTVLKWTAIGAAAPVVIPLVIPLFLVMWALGDLPSC
jgi:hypothetical protein